MSSTVYFANAETEVAVTPVTFINRSGAVTDPETVTCTVTDPQGGTTAYTYSSGGTPPGEIVKTSTGNYALNIDGLAREGLYSFVWVGFGNSVQQVTPGTFRLLPWSTPGSGMTRWYTGMEELKSRLSIAFNDRNFSANDYEIQNAIQASKGFIDSYTMQHFDQVTEARTFVPWNIWELDIDPLCSGTDLIADVQVNIDLNGDGIYEQAWTNNVDYQLKFEPQGEYNAHSYGVRRPYKRLQVTQGGPGGNWAGQWLPFIWPFTRYDRVQIVGTWGWDEIPPAVREASIMLCVDMFKLKDAPFGNMGMADIGVVKASANPMIVELLRPFINVAKKVGV